MTIEIKRMLRRVVGEVFGDNIEVQFSTDPKAAHLHRARIASVNGKQTDVRLRASYEWFDAHISELDVGAILFDYDDIELERRLSFAR